MLLLLLFLNVSFCYINEVWVIFTHLFERYYSGCTNTFYNCLLFPKHIFRLLQSFKNENSGVGLKEFPITGANLQCSTKRLKSTLLPRRNLLSDALLLTTSFLDSSLFELNCPNFMNHPESASLLYPQLKIYLWAVSWHGAELLFSMPFFSKMMFCSSGYLVCENTFLKHFLTFFLMK